MRVNTIRSSAEISRLFETGKRVNTPDLSLIVLRNEEQHDLAGRVAFIAGKKLGNAVWRNRAKRRMRALCVQAGGPFPGYDVVFLARRSVNEARFGNMLQAVEKALKKANIDKR